MPPSDASAPGSSGKNRPWSRRCSLSCLRVMPGSTTQSRSCAFTASTLFMSRKSTDTPPRGALMWPSSEVPVPNGMTGTRCAAQMRTIVWTSAVVCGNTTASGASFSIQVVVLACCSRTACEVTSRLPNSAASAAMTALTAAGSRALPAGCPCTADLPCTNVIATDRSIGLEIFGDVDLLRHGADLGRKVDELLKLGLVRGGQVARHEISHHRHRIDDVLGRERILGEILARLLGILVHELDALPPDRGKAPGDIGASLDEVAGERAAGGERVAVLIAQDVLGDHAGFERARDAELAHGRRLWLERVAGIERAGGHHVDVLAHVELVDRVVALLEPDLGEHRLGGDDVGRSGSGHDPRALEVLEGFRRITFADHELLHLVGFVLAVHADIHGDARLLEVGVHRLDGDEHDRRLDLIADHRRDVGRPADQPDRLRLDVLLLEEPPLDRHEIRQRGRGRKYADLHLVLRDGSRTRAGHHRGDQNRDRAERLQQLWHRAPPSISGSDARACAAPVPLASAGDKRTKSRPQPIPTEPGALYPSIQSPHFCTSPLAPQGMIGTDEVEFFGEPSMILSE